MEADVASITASALAGTVGSGTTLTPNIASVSSSIAAPDTQTFITVSAPTATALSNSLDLTTTVGPAVVSPVVATTTAEGKDVLFWIGQKPSEVLTTSGGGGSSTASTSQGRTGASPPDGQRGESGVYQSGRENAGTQQN